MTRTHVAAVAVATLAVSLTVAACSNSAPPSGVPTTSSSSSPSPSTTPTTTDRSVPAYLIKYSPAQRTAYWHALDTYRAYLKATEPLFRSGKATPAALRRLKQLEVLWESDWAALQQDARYGLHLIGAQTVVRSSPTRIVLSQAGSSVTLRACVDSHHVKAVQQGKVLPKRGPDPVVNVVEVDSMPNGTWKVTQQKTTSQPC